MKRFQTIAAVAMLVTQASFAGVGPSSLTEFPQRYLPVLVNVDAKGKVTDVSPSSQLPP
jgi:hypothetical protein